uniref:Uncharacterized protein n=1 Tax=Tetranychus urticae TaxID=32264 RepID=T1K6X6_TETUR
METMNSNRCMPNFQLKSSMHLGEGPLWCS